MPQKRYYSNQRRKEMENAIRILTLATEELQRLLPMQADAVVEFELAKHGVRERYNEEKANGLKITEEAIRTKSVMETADEFKKVTELAAKVDIEKASIELAKYMIRAREIKE